MKAFGSPKYEILVGLKFSILVAQSAIILGNTQTGDDDEKQLGWMTTHNWVM